MSAKRKQPEDRIEEILICATEISREKDYRCLNRNVISKRLGISRGLVNTYFGNIEGLQYKVIERALENNDQAVLVQPVLDKLKQVAHLSLPEKRKILLSALKS